MCLDIAGCFASWLAALICSVLCLAEEEGVEEEEEEQEEQEEEEEEGTAWGLGLKIIFENIPWTAKVWFWQHGANTKS